MWESRFADLVARDVALAPLTTVRIGGTARTLVRPRSVEDLQGVLAALAADGLGHRVLGGGSNLLPPDGVVEDVVIHPSELTGVCIEGDLLHVGAGHATSALVSDANSAGLAGAQVLAGIPGQVGGALMMNAGGRYGDIGSLVEFVTVCLPGGEMAEIAGTDAGFGYRSSRFPDGAVLVSAALRLKPVEDIRALKRESGRILKEKNAAQPTTTWNFGCMWKNPPGHSAGVLVQDSGLCGRSEGGARISPRHGNFVENVDEARAADVLALMELAEREVKARTGVELEREVRVWPAGHEALAS